MNLNLPKPFKYNQAFQFAVHRDTGTSKTIPEKETNRKTQEGFLLGKADTSTNQWHKNGRVGDRELL